jgi:ectoine hydroxylase-related dioxygenase (phytanoyl-CoA dioxygenase family)
VDGFHAVEDADLHRPLTKVLDTFAFAPSALKLMFAPKIVEFLRAIFDDSILAHQGLHFEVGSTQAIHQDTSYVVVDKPLNLAASWIALEDIQEGTGELVYYPGSHRFPHQLYQGDKHWNPTRDGNEAHARHLAWLHEEAKARGIAQTSFLPKKGDALIWHADLAHGGGQITREGATRRSLVTHYCPLSNTPHYFQHATHCRKVPVGDNAISSFYYPLAHQQLEPV